MCSIQQHQVDVRSTSSCCGSCLPMHAAACLTNWRKHSDERRGSPRSLHVAMLWASRDRWSGVKRTFDSFIPLWSLLLFQSNLRQLQFHRFFHCLHLQVRALDLAAKSKGHGNQTGQLEADLRTWVFYSNTVWRRVSRACRKREDVARRRVQSARWQARIAMHFLFFGKTLHVGPCCIQSLTIDLSC